MWETRPKKVDQTMHLIGYELHNSSFGELPTELGIVTNENRLPSVNNMNQISKEASLELCSLTTYRFQIMKIYDKLDLTSENPKV